MLEAVGVARANGRSWREIGAVLGMSAQAAQRRYAPNPRPHRGELERELVKLFRERLPEGFTRDSAGIFAAEVAEQVAARIGWSEAKVRRHIAGALKSAWDCHGPGDDLPRAAAKRVVGSVKAAGLWRANL